MELKTYFALDGNARVIPNVSFYVYLAGTNTLAPYLEDENGVELPNPFSSGTTGKVFFSAPNGDYDIRSVKNGVESVERVQFNDVSDSVDAAVAAAAAAEEAASKAADETVEQLQGRIESVIQTSGYQFVGDYAAGVELTEYNQLVRDENGEFWRVSGQVDLPYITTGAGVPEDDALVPAGDAVLRQDLANPDMGAEMVGYGDYPEYTDGVGKAIQEARRELLPTMQDISAFKNAYSRRYVDKFAALRARSPAGRAYIWKNPTLVAGGENYRFSLGVNMSGYRTAEWDFISDVDGYYRLRYGRTGPIRPPSLAINATSFSQDPVTVGDNAYFSATSGMGASFTVDFEGTGLITNHYVDNRGGVFSVVVDGGAPFFISTHASNPENAEAIGASISKLIASGLPHGQHSAVFTFIGDDPNYPPEGGVSRGWFKYENGVDPEAYTANVITGSEMGLAATGTRISANGILDFAISGRPVDSSFDSSWVPSHGSASGSILVTSRKIYLNEILLDDNLSTINSEVEIKEFTLTQTYLAYNTNDASHTMPMWEGEITTKFTRERGLEFFHDLTFLEDTEIAEGYMAMCSGRRAAGYTRVEFDNGTFVDISGPTPEALVTHNPGMAQSAAWLGSTAGLALSVPYVEASAGIGRASAAAQTMLLTERTDDFVKCYYRMCEQGAVLAAGTRLCSAHAIWLGTL